MVSKYLIFIPALVISLLLSKASFAQEVLPDNLLSAPTASLGRVAVIQILNKISARNSTIKIPAGTSEKFGNIKVKISDCWKSAPSEKPEVATLLKIDETKTGEDEKNIFYGWMFASTPAISALEHPVYDVGIIDCISSQNNG